MASKEGTKLIPYTVDSKIIKDRREFLGLSREDLANRIGYGKVMVGHVERGRNKGSDQFLEKAADALFLTPKCLLKEFNLPVLESHKRQQVAEREDKAFDAGGSFLDSKETV